MYILALRCAVHGLKLGFASIPALILCCTLILYLFTVSDYIHARCIYLHFLLFFSDSCVFPFLYSATIWWNPSVPLGSKPYRWRCLNGRDNSTSHVTQNGCHSG